MRHPSFRPHHLQLAPLVSLLLLFSLTLPATAQVMHDAEGYELDENGNRIGQERNIWGRDSVARSRNVPVGSYVWRVDETLGERIPAIQDTIPHGFPNETMTDGMTGTYNYLGVLGSPRQSRIFMDRPFNQNFIFTQPYDYWLQRPGDFHFTNTKSPLTNLTYISCGDKQNGEDRIRARFATNINKRAGIGFNIDYLYAPGYYAYQANSLFGASLYGYYLGERYNMHAYLNANHMKLSENGGIDDDTYIVSPENKTQTYETPDIPVRLYSTWNRNDNQTFFLTQRYNIGFHRYVQLPDSLRPVVPADSILLSQSFPDSIPAILQDDKQRTHVLDSLRLRASHRGVPQEFVPVTSIIHTLLVEHNERIFQQETRIRNYYTQQNYGSPYWVYDKTLNWKISNTLALSLREGFNRWAKGGLSAYIRHEYQSYALPTTDNNDGNTLQTVKENTIHLGGQLLKSQGRLLHYNVQGEIGLAGDNAGDIQITGHGDLNFRLLRDTLQLALNAHFKHLRPSYYLRHYHAQHAWWDNSLDKEMRTRIEGIVQLRRTNTTLRVGVENLTGYTYLQHTETPLVGSDGYSHSVSVQQAKGAIQVLSAQLSQNFRLGILHWDNQVTWQTCTDVATLPLPNWNLYTNLYIQFRLAKVLLTEVGADARYFSQYNAPSYCEQLGQYANASGTDGVKLGGYPFIGAYLNFHLKHCRFFVMAQNLGDGKFNRHSFLVPHYPVNPMTIRFGLSWNFFN